MRLAARNLLILPAVGSALKFQQQQAPKAPAVALNRRQLLTLPAAALALPQSARADGQAWAGPRWAEVDTKLPTNDQARVFRDLEDGFEVAYPSATRRLRMISRRCDAVDAVCSPRRIAGRTIGCARSRFPSY